MICPTGLLKDKVFREAVMVESDDRNLSVTIYYDGDCPFCSDYVSHLRLRQSVGPPTLMNLREAPDACATLESEGFDLDRGMVVDIENDRYGGADALHALALLTTSSGLFNRVTGVLFASKNASRVLYPLLRAGRNSVLTMLGRQPFRREDKGWHSLFIIFSLVFGLFAYIHFFSYAFRFTRFDLYPSTWLILFFGTWLFLWPTSKRAFVLLILAMLTDAWLHAPMHSNHTILKNFLLLAILGSGGWHLLRGSSFLEFFRDIVPVGRILLLTMYFFGVFHKINEGFVDPVTSCAVGLWKVMPWPIYLIDFPLVHYSAIYGTFIIETAIALMLLIFKWRALGIIFGIGFHGFLALSGFAMYPAFTTLAVTLHVLFLTPEQAQRITSGENFLGLMRSLRSWRGALLLLLCGGIISSFAINRNFNMVALAWLMLAFPVFLTILVPGKPTRIFIKGSEADFSSERFLWSRLRWLNIVGVLFFLNCAMPYFGLKTAQAMNMFANLRLEGGVNNHLIMRFSPKPFDYLDEVIEVREINGVDYRHAASGSAIGWVYYDLLNRLDRQPQMKVSFIRDGILYRDQTAETLSDEIKAKLHSEWFRKWFHFQIVLLDNPPPCR